MLKMPVVLQCDTQASPTAAARSSKSISLIRGARDYNSAVQYRG